MGVCARLKPHGGCMETDHVASDIVNHLVATTLDFCSDCHDPLNLLDGKHGECANCGGRFHEKCGRCACNEAEEAVIVTVNNCFFIGEISCGGEWTWN